MHNFTTFQTKADFYEFWKVQDHQAHNSNDFVFYALCVSILNEEDEEQAARRLMRALPAIHAKHKWAGAGRMPYDTLLSSLRYIRGIFVDMRFPSMLEQHCNFAFNTFKKNINPDKESCEPTKLLFTSLAGKIAALALADAEAEANHVAA